MTKEIYLTRDTDGCIEVWSKKPIRTTNTWMLPGGKPIVRIPFSGQLLKDEVSWSDSDARFARLEIVIP